MARAFQKCPSGVPRADFVSLGVPQNFEVSLGVPQFFRSVPHSEGHIWFYSVPRLFLVSLKNSECPFRVLQMSRVPVITRDTPDLLLFHKRWRSPSVFPKISVSLDWSNTPHHPESLERCSCPSVSANLKVSLGCLIAHCPSEVGCVTLGPK